MKRKTDFLKNFYSEIASFLGPSEKFKLQLSIEAIEAKKENRESNKGPIWMSSQLARASDPSHFGESDKENFQIYQDKEQFVSMMQSVMDEQSPGKMDDSFEELLMSENAEKLRQRQKANGSLSLKNSNQRKNMKSNIFSQLTSRSHRQKKHLLANLIAKKPIVSQRISTLTNISAESKKIRRKRTLNTGKKIILKERPGKHLANMFTLGKKKLKLLKRANALEKMGRTNRQIQNLIAKKFVFTDSRKDLICLNDHISSQIKQTSYSENEFIQIYSKLNECDSETLLNNFRTEFKIASITSQKRRTGSKENVICKTTIQNQIEGDFAKFRIFEADDKSIQQELKSLSHCIFLRNLQSLLYSLDSIMLSGRLSNKKSWLDQALAKITKCSHSQKCLGENPQICCILLTLLQLLLSCELYISRISLKNVMNIPIVIDCEHLLNLLGDSLLRLTEIEFLSSNAQFARYLGMIDRFLVYQIKQYSALFKQPSRDWDSYPLQKNIKILVKIISQFRKLTGEQIEKIKEATRNKMSFPEKPNMSMETLLALIGQSR